MNTATRDFIESHLKDDVRQLALQKFPDDVDKMLVLNQIEARQLLSKKVPYWASNPDLLFPKHLSLEQCSSELTAKYKASLVENGDVFVDLTGGLGIDSYFLSEKFKTSYYVENQKGLCDLAEHNFTVLGRKITVVNEDSESFLSKNQNFDLVFIDPARRDIYNRKMVSLHDCSPDVIDLQNILLKNAKNVLIKASPMLDISLITNELKNISEIHIVSVKNECKEILVKIEPEFYGEIKYFCVDLNLVETRHDTSLQFTENDEKSAIPTFAITIKKYLYEPNAALMKAGAFKLVSQRFGIDKLHINSHLYTSDKLIPDFPGRIFEVVDYAPFSKKIKKELLKDVAEASVAVRNFPLSANELRKSLNLKESDENFVFGTTLMGEKKVVVLCKRI
jgi:16S rRNA G966 N2-methylase RsmD